MKGNHGLKQFIDEEGGATSIEYALMAASIAAVVVVVVTTLGQLVLSLFTDEVQNALDP